MELYCITLCSWRRPCLKRRVAEWKGRAVERCMPRVDTLLPENIHRAHCIEDRERACASISRQLRVNPAISVGFTELGERDSL